MRSHAVVTIPLDEFQHMQNASSMYYELSSSMFKLAELNDDCSDYRFSILKSRELIEAIIDRLNNHNKRVHGEDFVEIDKLK